MEAEAVSWNAGKRAARLARESEVGNKRACVCTRHPLVSVEISMHDYGQFFFFSLNTWLAMNHDDSKLILVIRLLVDMHIWRDNK